jgi:glyoxylase I family protein
VTTINGITHVSLSVRDLDQSARFYREVLGLTVLVEGIRTDAYNEVILLIPGRAGIALCLQAHRTNDGSAGEPDRTGLDHLAFAVADRDVLDEWAARLDELGVEHSGVKSNSGFGHLIALRDPDGIQLELHTMA